MAVDKDGKEIVEPVVDDLEGPEELVDEDPILEPDDKPADPKSKVHPLHPGGIRFEQIYAKGKQAERERDQERDKRIAAEAKLEALTNNTTSGTKEYTRAEIEDFVTQGRISRADAEAYREDVITKNVLKKAKDELNQSTQTLTRGQALQAGITQYVQAVPAIMTEGSEDRIRLDEEFDFLASVEGLDTSKIDDLTRKRLQLTALRGVYGSVDALTKRSASVKQPDTQRELPGGIKPTGVKNPDQALLDGLSKAQVQHYNKMFRAGRYPNKWKDVVEELKYTAPVKARR